MASTVEPEWTDTVAAADWIVERLSPENWPQITSFVPRGFEAYARILHPADGPGDGSGSGRLVRWHEVAEWSGMPLRNDAQFHSVAMPPDRPEAESPTRQRPRVGSLYAPDALIVAHIGERWTATADRCWFCVWEGYGWFPDSSRHGPRVQLPNRDYVMCTAPVASVLSPMSGAPVDRSPNLWWPHDRAWCVASEIDLQWTYVGGPSGMIEELLENEDLEALPVDLNDPITRVEGWIEALTDAAIAELTTTGRATIRTWKGTVMASFVRPKKSKAGEIRIKRTGVIDSRVQGGGGQTLNFEDDEIIESVIRFHLTNQLILMAEASASP
jgi:hypothetical protein